MKNSVKSFNKALGAVIREERRKRGWSMEALGGMLGFTYQQQQKYESGLNGCSAELVARMAEVFQLTVASLYECAGIQMRETPVPTAEDNDALLVSRNVKRIKDGKLRQAVIDFTRKLAYEGAVV